ncbi:hypothetical protein CCICO_01765 [Corynebacterium ciconiae DSM 44920]|nr:hypothetical protein CCICO_01765 [Corynebacterium ciconiae DSM 44920]
MLTATSLVFLLPGFVFALLSGLRPSSSAAMSLPLSFGIYGLLAWLAGAIAKDYDGGFIRGGIISLWVLAALWGVARLVVAQRRFARDRGGEGWGEASSRITATVKRRLRDSRTYTWLIAAAGVLLGVSMFLRRGLDILADTPEGIGSIHQGWDVEWHANVVRYIAENHMASPTRMGEVLSPEPEVTQFYPSGWHAGVFALVDATDYSVIEALNISSIMLPAMGFVMASAYVAWRILGSRGMAAGLAAGFAAIIVYAIPAVFWIGHFVGAWPYIAGVGMAMIAGCAMMKVPDNPGRALAAGMAFLGATQVHSAVATIVVTLVACYWLFHQLFSPSTAPENWRERILVRAKDVGLLAATGAGAMLVLLPQIVAGLGATEEVEAFGEDYDLSRSDAWYHAATLQTRHTDMFEIHMGLIWLALAGGIVAIVWRRAVWAAAAYGLFLAVTTQAFEPFGTWVEGPLQSISALHYNAPHRLVIPVGIFVAAGAGVAVAAAVRLVSLAPVSWWLRRRQLRRARAAAGEHVHGHDYQDPAPTRQVRTWAAASAAVSLLFAGIVAIITTDEAEAAVRGGDSWAVGSTYTVERMVTPYDRHAFDWLAQQPGAYEGTIIGEPADGHGWMYAYNGLPSVFKHYQWPEPPIGSPTHIAHDYPNLVGAGTAYDPDEENFADEMVKKLNVKYFISSPPIFWPFQHPHLRLDHGSWEAPGLTPVYKDHDTVIWAVNENFTDEELLEIRANSRFSPEKLPPLPTRVNDEGEEVPYFHRPTTPNKNHDRDPKKLSATMQGWRFKGDHLDEPPRGPAPQPLNESDSDTDNS